MRMKSAQRKAEVRTFRSRTLISLLKSLDLAMPEGHLLHESILFPFGAGQKLGLHHLQPRSWNHDTSQSPSESHPLGPGPPPNGPASPPTGSLGLVPQLLHGPCHPPNTSCHHMLIRGSHALPCRGVVCPRHPRTHGFRAEMWPHHLTPQICPSLLGMNAFLFDTFCGLGDLLGTFTPGTLAK